MKSTPILDRVHTPADVRNLSPKELPALSKEIRTRIVEVVSRNGGHLASNLGVVELTIALHRVFETPFDKIVWDVGHQCYAHKLLTGRAGDFDGLRRKDGLSGFPKRSESVHDSFDTGHSSTSISAALGLLAAERICGGKGHAVAVIGDGALTGGMAYEGLAHAGQLGLPLVIILNDNKMSIGPNVGALSQHLSRLSMKGRYQSFRRGVDRFLRRIPFAGSFLYEAVQRLKRGVKAVFYHENFFVDLGFEYVGPIDGHNLPLLEQVIRDAKNLNHPVVVHVNTRKGKGYEFAEDDPSFFHGVTPFSISDGKVERSGAASFTEAFGKAVLSLAGEDERVVAVCAAMEKGTGLSAFRKAFPSRFFDVGIAEQHALTFSAGLAARGLRPIVAVYSTFSQRAVDQIVHDIAIQDLPVTIALDRSGFVPDDGETHQGLFDISLFRAIPNLTLLAPASGVEMESMLRWSVASGRPCVIRYPKTACPPETEAFSSKIEEGRGCLIRNSGAPVLLAFIGSLYPQTVEAADLLAAEGLAVDVYNLRFIKPVDENGLATLLSRYELVVVLEEGSSRGGFGEYLAAYASRIGLSARILAKGVPDLYPPHASREELLDLMELDGQGIASAVSQAYRNRAHLSLVLPTSP